LSPGGFCMPIKTESWWPVHGWNWTADPARTMAMAMAMFLHMINQAALVKSTGNSGNSYKMPLNPPLGVSELANRPK